MDLTILMFQVRDKLNGIGIDKYDDKFLYRDLQDAYDTIQMIADTLNVILEDYSETSLQRCVIKLGTYYGYRNYTRLAESQLSNEPTTSSLQVAYDTAECRRCLTYLFGVQFDENLIPVTMMESHKPTISRMGPSIADFGYDNTT